MKNRQIRHFACLLAVPCLAACGSDDEFRSPPFQKLSDVRAWANSGSAVGVYSNIYQPIAFADGQPGYPDPECPVVEDDGTTWSATGGCTDSEGKAWKGTVTVVRDGDDRALTFDSFQGDEGTAEIHQVAADRHEFEVQLVLGGVTTIDYAGSVMGGYGMPTLWNGSGHVKREGVLSPNGEVDASTLDEVVDNDSCAGQPFSGKTTLESGDDVAVITYDGETDCDDDENAQLTVNDEDRGLIDGITCAVRAPGAGRSGWAAALVGLLVLGARRRRCG